jgi:hypothetical protein
LPEQVVDVLFGAAEYHSVNAIVGVNNPHSRGCHAGSTRVRRPF